MKDAVATMGGLLPQDAGGRDAVHVAVFSAFAIEKLFPSQAVSVVEQRDRDTMVSSSGESVGIVDPFLIAPVPPGERFWCYLYPRTITALSHRWSHPGFEATDTIYSTPASKVASEKWLRDFVQHSDCPSYDEVIGKAAQFAIGGGGTAQWDDEYLHFNGQDAHGEIPPEFWDHVAVILGTEIKGDRPKYFSCSC